MPGFEKQSTGLSLHPYNIIGLIHYICFTHSSSYILRPFLFYLSCNIISTTHSHHLSQLRCHFYQRRLTSGGACCAAHRLNAASLYQFNWKSRVCIFTSIENHNFIISKYYETQKYLVAATRWLEPNAVSLPASAKSGCCLFFAISFKGEIVLNAELKSTNTLRFSIGPCNWILGFFTSRPQRVMIGSHTSLFVLNTRGAPGLSAQTPSVHTVHLWLHKQENFIGKCGQDTASFPRLWDSSIHHQHSIFYFLFSFFFGLPWLHW